MPTATQTRRDRLVIEVAADGMTASIRMQDAERFKPPPEEVILSAIETAEVAVDDDVRRRVAEYVGLNPQPGVFVVAEGKPVRHAEDERFVWGETYEQECAAWQDEAPVNYYAPSDIFVVAKGDEIGRLEPPRQPEDGTTVRGEAVVAQGTPKELTLDASVERSPDDDRVIIAGATGRVVDDDLRLRIEDIQAIDGDVCSDTGDIDSHVPVHVSGRIVDRLTVRSEKSIIVCRAIEAANVTAVDDVIVQRGIIGSNTGVVNAGGEIVAKFATEANLVCGGDLKIGRQLMNSLAFVGGRIIAEGASLIGGGVYTKDGLVVGTIGSDANVATRIVAGVHPATIWEIATLTRRAERAESLMALLRAAIESISRGASSASDDQRRHIASLERLIEEASQRAKGDQGRKESLLTKVYAAVTPTIRVSNVIYAGVSVRIADRETYFHKDLKGPVSIERRKIKNVTEIVAVVGRSGSKKILNNKRRSPQELIDGLELGIIGDHAQGHSDRS